MSTLQGIIATAGVGVIAFYASAAAHRISLLMPGRGYNARVLLVLLWPAVAVMAVAQYFLI